MTEWMREGESFVSGGSPWGDGAVATQGGGWMQEGAAFAEPLEESAPTRPYDEIDAFQDVTDMMELAAGPAPDQTAIVEQRLARTQNQLSFVEDAIRYGLETGDFDESYIARREELRNRLSRLNTQKNQLASGIPLTPIEGSGLEGEFETRWNDDGPQFLQDLDQIERGRVSEYVAEARENTSDYSPARVGTQIASGVSSLLEYWGRRGLGDDEGARDVYLQNYATQRASAEEGGLVESYVANAGESITKALVAGKAGGFPGIIAAFFADTYMQSFESGKSRGLSEDESHGYAVASATTEAVITTAFSLAGAGGFESMVTKTVGRDGRQRAALEISRAMREEGAEAALAALRRNKNVIVSTAEPALTRMVSSVYKKMPELFKQQVAEQLEEGLVSQLQYGRDLRTFGGEWSLEQAVNIGIDTAATTFLAVGAMRAADPKVREAIAKFAQEPSRANAKAVGLEYLGTKARREKVAEGVKAAAIREQLHAMVGRNLQSPEEADYLYGMLQARAESAGMTLDAYVAKNGLEFQVANWEERSEANKDNKGVMEMLAEPAFDPTPEGDNDRLESRRAEWGMDAANMGNPGSDPIPRVNTRTTIRKALDEVDFENPQSVRDAIDRVADLEGELAVQAELRREREANRGKARGPDAIRARLLDARRRGELREDAVEVADWLIRQNPEAFEDVGVSIRKQPPFGAGGHYNMASRIVTLFKTTDARSADTAAHELIHSLERYVPAKLSAEMNRGWLAEVKALLDKSMKDNDRDKYEIAVDLLRRAYGLDTLYTRVADNANAEFLKLAGADPSTMLDLRAADANLYHLTSPSEFWASQGAKLAASRSEAKTVFQQFKQWLRELITRIKSSLGTGADNAVIKSLNKILRGGTPELSGERNAFGDAVDTSVILNRFDLERQQLYRQQLDEQTEINTLAEKTPGKKKKANRAQIQFLRSEGRTVITAFEQADFASLVHELGHLFRQDLAGADLNAAARWAGVKKGRWSRDAEEKFADAFLKWVAEGKGPTPAVTRFFEKFAGYLTGLFDAHRKARMEPLKLTPEITGVFGRLMGEGAVLAQQTQQEAVSRAPVDAPDQPEAIFQINTGMPTGAPATPQPTTLAEAEQDPVYLRFRDLANHEVEEARRKAVFEADVASGDYKRISRAAEDARALERIAANPAQERAFVMQMVESVERGVDVSINNVADQYVVHYMRRAAIDVGDRALTRRINRMLRASRTLDAQKMGWRDPVEKRAGNYAQFVKQTLDTALTLDPPEVADKRATARTPEEHAALDAEAEAWVQRLIEKLAAVGVDINDLEALANDPIGATKVIELIRKSRGELEANESWIFEYWRNSILSGPQTQIVNPVSTLAFAALVYGLERPTQAAVDAIYLRGKKKGVRFGEIGPAASGLLRGLFPAFRNAYYSFVLTRPMLEESLGRLGETKLDTRPGAIPGKIGSIVRVPYKLLTAADDFTKTIIAHMEVGAVAYRVGKNRGMTGEDLGSFIESEVKNTNSASWDTAIDTAQQIAFQGEGGAVSTPVQNLIKAVQVNLPFGTGKFLVPFRKTPANIFEEGIRRMPIFGAILDLVEGARAGKPFKISGKNDEFYTGMFARQIVAMGLASALWSLNDDDEPWITGAKDLMDRNDKRTQYGAIPAMSIRVPGVGWVSYARLEPIATYLSATVDVVNGLKSGGPKQGAKDLGANAILQLTNKVYLDSVGDIIEGIIDFSQGESGGMYRWGTKFGASFVPNVWRQWQSPGYITQNRIWGKDEEFLKMALQRTAEQARVVEPYPLIDPWGREVPFSGQVSDFWLRLLNPFRIADEDRITQMDWAVRAWNRQNPNDKTSWATPDYFFRRNGETHYLTTAEYVEYSKRAGQYALERAEKINVNVEKPTKSQMTAIANAQAAGRRRARNELMPQWLDRIRSEGELRSNEQPPTPAR